MPRRTIRFGVPLALLALGIILLIGCIPIPATRQLQPNFKPRPEYSIGKGTHNEIKLGHTKIEDAFIAISRRLGPLQSGGGHELYRDRMYSLTEPLWSIRRWQVSPDH